MADGVSFDLDTRNFNRMAQALSRITGKSFDKIIKSEAGAILNIAVRRTRAAKARNIEESVRNWAEAREFRDENGIVTVNTGARGVKGRVWFSPDRGNTWFLPREWKLPADVWSRFQSKDNQKEAFIGELIAKRKRSRGLAKQSWKILAETLGEPIKAPAYVDRALARDADGKQFKPIINVEFFETGEIGYTLHLVNRSPAADNHRAKGGSAIASGVNGRVKFFERNLAEGIFDSFKTISRAYPGIDVTRG